MQIEENKLVLGGITARKLIEKYKSPLFVYEEETIRERAREFKKAISYEEKEIKFACKANTNIEIMKVLQEEGIGIDAVSPGEIYASFNAGYKPSDILFTANNVSWSEIEYAVSKGVMVNIDSLHQLKKFGECYPGGKLCIRINPDVGAGHHNHVITGGVESKFGISYTEVSKIKEIAKSYNVSIKGLHQHIGSGILDPDMFVKAMDVLLDVAINFEGLSFIDFGGGIGVPYRDDEKRVDVDLLGKKISGEFEKFCKKYGKALRLIIEPGRYLVAESGFLLATVTVVKEGERHRFVGIDTGFNHLVRPAMYGSYHKIIHADNVKGDKVLQTVAGNLCESGDTFTRDENGIVDRNLPEFKEGDIVCIFNAGAYGYSMSSFYNSRPRPSEVIVNGGNSRLIRKRDNIEDII